VISLGVRQIEEREMSNPQIAQIAEKYTFTVTSLNGEVAVANSFAFRAAELSPLLALARQGRVQTERAWNEHFGHRR
jgi:hypothetical protein